MLILELPDLFVDLQDALAQLSDLILIVLQLCVVSRRRPRQVLLAAAA